jgi:predicted transcriptional regulator
MADENSSRPLTEVELEVMTALWRLGEASAGHVREALAERRALAYTSVSTMLRILEQKGVVASRKEGRGHLYRPLVTKQEYESRSVHHLVARVFDGEPRALVTRLLEVEDLSAEDLAGLRELLDRKLGGAK